jgi:phage baseplate assembly protein W
MSMALDFQLAHQCPHLTLEEVVSLDTDRRSLQTIQPVATSNLVRVLVNNEFLVPRGGLFSSAQLYSGVSGPFDFTEGNDVLEVKTSSGTETISFGVVGTERLTTDEVIRRMQRADFAGVAAENINGHLTLSDINILGPESVVRVGGTAVGSFGWGDPHCRAPGQFSARGKQLYPGWRLASRPDTITNRFPQFIEPVRNTPVFKVSYATVVNRCRRCRATFVENDYRFDVTGQGVLIGNEDLLTQASLKILLTNRGSNPYHKWYGTTIQSRIGAKAIGNVSAVLNEDVRTALANFQAVQREQGKYQEITLKERLFQVLDVQVYPHAEDPTTFLISVTVQNSSSEPIALSIVFTVPEVVAVMGSNGLTLGGEIAGLNPNFQPVVVE